MKTEGEGRAGWGGRSKNLTLPVGPLEQLVSPALLGLWHHVLSAVVDWPALLGSQVYPSRGYHCFRGQRHHY